MDVDNDNLSIELHYINHTTHTYTNVDIHKRRNQYIQPQHSTEFCRTRLA